MFDDYAKHIDLNPKDSIFSLYGKIMNRSAGGGTNLQSALNEKSRLGFEPDTVIIMSDMEVNRLDGSNINNMFGKDCVKVAINLDSNGSTPICERDGWIQLSGFSERIFQYVKFTRESESIVSQLFNKSL